MAHFSLAKLRFFRVFTLDGLQSPTKISTAEIVYTKSSVYTDGYSLLLLNLLAKSTYVSYLFNFTTGTH